MTTPTAALPSIVTGAQFAVQISYMFTRSAFLLALTLSLSNCSSDIECSTSKATATAISILRQHMLPNPRIMLPLDEKSDFQLLSIRTRETSRTRALCAAELTIANNSNIFYRKQIEYSVELTDKNETYVSILPF